MTAQDSTSVIANYVSLKLPLVRIAKQKIAPTDTEKGKWRRIPEEKWKGIEHTKRPAESFHDCNIAIKTGHELPDGRRLYVLDIDLKNPNGANSLAYMELQHDLNIEQHPYVSVTESGGYHMYFASTSVLQVCTNLLAGVDFLGVGSIAFEAPSQFYEGERQCDAYRWSGEPLPPNAELIPQLPKWLEDLIETKNGTKRMYEERRNREDAESANLVGASLDFVTQCLEKYTPECGLVYADWLRIGMALHDATKGSDAGFEVFNNWGERVARERGGEYDERKTIISWDSFGQSNRDSIVRFGTLVRYLCTDTNCMKFINSHIAKFSEFSTFVKRKAIDEMSKSTPQPDADALLLAEFAGETQPSDDDLLAEFGGSPILTLEQSMIMLPTKNMNRKEDFAKKVAEKITKKEKPIENPKGIRMSFYDMVRNVGLRNIGLRFNAISMQNEVSFDGDNNWEPITEALEGDLAARCAEAGETFDIKELKKTTAVKKAILYICHKNKVNPIQSYLNTCLSIYKLEPYQHTNPRHYRDEFFSNVCMEDEEKTKRFCAAIEYWMTGLICKVLYGYTNEMIIIEGKQGTGKSTFAKALTKHIGHEYYYAGAIDAKDKDHRLKLSSLFIWEPDELDSAKSADINRLKSFITQRVINERPAYGRATLSSEAMCSLIGTTNESSYLKDLTGSRRFIVVDFCPVDSDAWVEYLYSDDFDPSMIFGEILNELITKNVQFPRKTKEFIEQINARNEQARDTPIVEDIIRENIIFGATKYDRVTFPQIRNLLAAHLGKCDNRDFALAKKVIVKYTSKKAEYVIGRDERAGMPRSQCFKFIKMVDKQPEN